MTSREIFKAALDFDNPPRVAMTLPEPYPNDVRMLDRNGVLNKEPLEPHSGEVRRWRDEWGVTWASLTEFDKGEVAEPAISDWSELDGYQPPDLGRKEDYTEAAQQFAEATKKFCVGCLPGFTFNVARKLRKLDNYLCDLVLEPENVRRLNIMVREQLLASIDRWGEMGVDAIFFCEDWGTQDSLMINPELWREVFLPEFKALAGRAHEHGMYVLMHSCGKMTDIIEDCIACGVNCFQFDQPTLHEIDVLAERFGGRVAFWCPVDIQKTLQTKSPELIRAGAKELVEKLGGFGGGFIAGYYGNNEAIGITADIQDIACKAFVEFGSDSLPKSPK